MVIREAAARTASARKTRMAGAGMGEELLTDSS
jgi:hypothetical protein